jgi:Na+/proline symporter
MLTKTRGNCKGNVIGMIAGFVAVGLLTNLPNDLWGMFFDHPLYTPEQAPKWLPTIAFTWRIMFGTLVTVGVAMCFRSKDRGGKATTPADSSALGLQQAGVPDNSIQP